MSPETRSFDPDSFRLFIRVLLLWLASIGMIACDEQSSIDSKPLLVPEVAATATIETPQPVSFTTEIDDGGTFLLTLQPETISIVQTSANLAMQLKTPPIVDIDGVSLNGLLDTEAQAVPSIVVINNSTAVQEFTFSFEGRSTINTISHGLYQQREHLTGELVFRSAAAGNMSGFVILIDTSGVITSYPIEKLINDYFQTISSQQPL